MEDSMKTQRGSGSAGLFEMIVGVLTTCHTQYTSDSSICIFYLTEQHPKFLLLTLQVLYMCTLCDSTGLFKMIVRVLTACHTQYTWDRSICIFLFNRTTLPVFVTYLTWALYVHPLWFYKHQHDNPVRSKLFVACQRWWFQWRFWFVPSVPGYTGTLSLETVRIIFEWNCKMVLVSRIWCVIPPLPPQSFWITLIYLVCSFKLDARCGWVVNAMSLPLYPRERHQLLIIQEPGCVPGPV